MSPQLPGRRGRHPRRPRGGTEAGGGPGGQAEGVPRYGGLIGGPGSIPLPTNAFGTTGKRIGALRPGRAPQGLGFLPLAESGFALIHGSQHPQRGWVGFGGVPLSFLPEAPLRLSCCSPPPCRAPGPEGRPDPADPQREAADLPADGGDERVRGSGPLPPPDHGPRGVPGELARGGPAEAGRGGRWVSGGGEAIHPGQAATRHNQERRPPSPPLGALLIPAFSLLVENLQALIFCQLGAAGPSARPGDASGAGPLRRAETFGGYDSTASGPAKGERRPVWRRKNLSQGGRTP